MLTSPVKDEILLRSPRNLEELILRDRDLREMAHHIAYDEFVMACADEFDRLDQIDTTANAMIRFEEFQNMVTQKTGQFIGNLGIDLDTNHDESLYGPLKGNDIDLSLIVRMIPIYEQLEKEAQRATSTIEQENKYQPLKP